MAAPPHLPVMPDAVRELVAARPGETVVDGTFGAGGHARVLLADLAGDPSSLYVAVDRDPSVRPLFVAFAREAAAAGVATRLVHAAFPDAFEQLVQLDGVSADAVILDVGVSSMQLDQPERGFAYSYDAPLDMRMDPTHGATAADLVAQLPEADLARVLREFGEERHAGRIARAIVRRREQQPFVRTADLADTVRGAVPAAVRHGPGGHPAKRTFQALRIAVNDELAQLDRGLDRAFELLAPGGRLVVIAFHSLEDRMVKRRFESWLGRCVCPPGLPVCRCGAHAQAQLLTRRAVKAPEAELAANPRAKSARLRAVRKLQEEGAA